MLSQNIAPRHFEKLQKQERQSCPFFVFPPQSKPKPHSQYREASSPLNPGIQRREPSLFLKTQDHGRMWANSSCWIWSLFGNLSFLLHPRTQVILAGSFFFPLAVKILKKKSLTLKCVESQLALSLGKMWTQEMTVASWRSAHRSPVLKCRSHRPKR